MRCVINILILFSLIALTACESSDGSTGGGTSTQNPTDQTSTAGDTQSTTDTSSNNTNTSVSFDTFSSTPDTSTSGTQQDTTSSNTCTYHYDPPTPDLCPGDQICILDNGLGGPGHCEGAFGRVYTVNLGNVSVPERRSDGECWDVGCGSPDLFFEVLLDGQTILRTTTIDDRLSVESINELGNALIVSGSVLSIMLYDEDLSSNDFIIGCELNPVSADDLRARLFRCGLSLGPNFAFGLILQ